MRKHPEITRSRLQAFLKNDLMPAVTQRLSDLDIEINENPCHSQTEAEPGPWKPVERGHRYGPAYTTFWFRVRGAIPEVPAGKTLGLVAEVGGERTVWKGNSPFQGLDVEHDVMWGVSSPGVMPFEGFSDGKNATVYIQSYTRNTQTTVVGKEKPREPLTETVKDAYFVAIDEELKQLMFDVEFGLLFLQAVETGDPAYDTVLRALNDVANTYDPAQRETIARSRKLLRDALGTLNGELKHTIVPVGHAHLDTAWLWPIEITKKKMAHTTSNQLALMERYPEYVFVHSQASQYEWLEKEYPELFERVKAAIKKGQWEPVGSMWVEADCNLTGGESLVRQFLYGRRYFREKLGVETQDMWLPDVFGYSAALPQILAKSNISYFLTQKISWNDTNKFPHNTFLWQGIDGTKIWTHFPPADTYNGNSEPKEIVDSVRKHRDKARSDMSLYLFGFGDGGGGPTERHLELLRRGRVAPNYPEIASGKRALSFFREAKAKSRDLQTWVGELYAEFHRGTYTTQAANKKGNRYSEFLLRDAEMLCCFTDGYPSSYPTEELEQAWKLVLLNQFHDIIPGSSVREVYVDSDRDYATIREIGERIVDESLRSVGGKFDTSGMTRPVALFQNSDATGEAEIAWDEETVPTAVVAGDEVYPVQLVEAFGERKLVFPTPHAAMKTVCVADLTEHPNPLRSRLKASNRRIENNEFSVRFDAHGNIVSIQSLEDGTEFIEPGKLANLFQIFEDKPRFWTAWDIDVYAFETGQDLIRSESFEIVERGPVRVAAEIVKRFGNSTLRQRISLGPTPGIRFDTEIDWREEDKLLKVAFPVNVNAARATYEIQFGNVERPTHSNTSWDQARFEVCAQKWADLSEGDQGLAILNDCKYGHDVHGNVMRLSLLRSPKAPDPMADMGVHRFTYCVLPHFGPYHYGGVVDAAYALNAPTRVARLTPSSGEEGVLPALVECEDRNIVVETVKKAEDDADLIVRVYECHNSRGRAELSCARPVRQAFLCDLEENPVTELEVNDGMVLFPYRPFEIITLRLKV